MAFTWAEHLIHKKGRFVVWIVGVVLSISLIDMIRRMIGRDRYDSIRQGLGNREG